MRRGGRRPPRRVTRRAMPVAAAPPRRAQPSGLGRAQLERVAQRPAALHVVRDVDCTSVRRCLRPALRESSGRPASPAETLTATRVDGTIVGGRRGTPSSSRATSGLVDPLAVAWYCEADPVAGGGDFPFTISTP